MAADGSDAQPDRLLYDLTTGENRLEACDRGQPAAAKPDPADTREDGRVDRCWRSATLFKALLRHRPGHGVTARGVCYGCNAFTPI
ncbi:MAG: hypothetical protein WDN69_13500 [Aliidongia sp.]